MIIRKNFLRLMTAALIAIVVMGGSSLFAWAQNLKPASLDIEAMTRAIQRAVDDLAESDFTKWKLALAGGVRTRPAEAQEGAPTSTRGCCF